MNPNEKINSAAYWDERFSSGDWDQYDGDQQTAFFVREALAAFPAWLLRELAENEREVADLGCAEGAGTALLTEAFPRCRVVGSDFSPAAIRKASEKYPRCSFQVADFTQTLPETDLVFCSNVLEHFENPEEIMRSMLGAARRHAVFLLPLRDAVKSPEHFRYFDESFFPVKTERHHLSAFRILDCRRKKPSFFPGEQLLLIYSDDRLYPVADLRLADLFENGEYADAGRMLDDASDRLRFAEDSLKEALKENERLENALRESEENAYDLSNDLRTATALANERQEALENAFRQTSSVLSICAAAERSRGLKLLNFLRRWKYQGFSRDRAERRAFRRWLRLRLFKGKTDSDRRFSPLRQILLPLQNEREFLQEAVSGNFSFLPEPVVDGKTPSSVPACSCLNEPYRLYDVIIFSVIDYDFRYQRPQQIADYFAESGHRVYYLNAGFCGSDRYSVQNKKNGLRVVTLPNQAHGAVYSTVFTDNGADLPGLLDELVAREGIRDALLVLDYPNWISGARYLKKRYGFVMAADYMDDYLGFKDTSNRKTEFACRQMLSSCDIVIASSDHLAKRAEQYSQNVHIVRNGTEFSHFHRAANREKKPSAKKVIGYYGAISHWFDFKTVEVLSRRFPQERIVLIGAVTEGRELLESLPNVELPGEKPYAELPDLLADFDVCLIPFDASTDLIKATNPVKFYEYLSAGKKVVATEIPELQPFAGKYVYLENDRERFADRVAECLNGTDTLAPPEACMAFARENDWAERTRCFSELAERCFPSVSIVLLCYNQLEYTKQCVKSILEKTAYPNYELVIVDNCSTDGTAEWLSEEAKNSDRIRPVFNTENRGFAGGNNDGIRASGGEYVVLLNNDTLVTRGWLTGLVKWARREGVGMAGPVTNSIGNEAMINVSYGKNVKKMDAAAYEYTARRMGREYPHDGILAMFCVIFRRDLTEKIGLLDEGYGVGMFEDDDYSAAVRREGLRLVLAEDVFIHHFGSVSFKKLKNETYRKLFEKNKAYYETKWHTEWKAPRYRPGVNPEE